MDTNENIIKVSVVSYINSKPFIWGLNHNDWKGKMEWSIDVPSDCAKKLINNEADIGLIPIAALREMPYYEIVSDYCIGADGAVDSVFIVSKCPIEEVKSISYDAESRTSNNLARILMKHHWKVKPNEIADNADAQVIIGDKAFRYANNQTDLYVYDLAEVWKQMTGLPFAFAVWASNKPIPADFIQKMNYALANGLAHREEVIKGLQKFTHFDVHDYLMNKIDYNLNNKKREAIKLYLGYLSDLI